MGPRSRGSLGDRLRAERARRFVGRDVERARFRAMLEGTSAAAVLWIHGPGGVGKTTLLTQLRDDAEAAGRTVAAVDGRDLDLSPGALWSALAHALGLPAPEAIADALAAAPHALFIDTYDVLDELDGWVRDDLVPSLPDGTLLVFAGRELPRDWRVDPGLAGLVEVVGLRNLTLEEGRDVLARRGVRVERQHTLAAATLGHPLALALVAELPDELGAGEFQIDDAPDVVQALLDCFVRTVPSPRHRDALFLAAEVPGTTEQLLTAAFDSAAAELYDWLRGLSFMERGPHGLFPHDLARDVISAELRAREPATREVLHRVARDHFIGRFDAAPDHAARLRAYLDLMYLHRHSPLMQRVLDHRRLGTATVESLQAPDADAVVELTRTRVGAQTAAVLARWMARTPAGCWVSRDPSGDLSAFLISSDLDRDQLVAGAGFDPALTAIRRFLDGRGGLRDGELIHVGRHTDYRDGSPLTALAVHNAFMATTAVRWLTPPGVAWSFYVVRASRSAGSRNRWLASFEYGDHGLLDGSSFELDGVRFDVVGHDWRATPRAAWFELMATRQLSTATDPGQLEPPRTAPLVVLSEPEFRDAVRAAFRELMHDDRLARSPLLRSRVVRDAGGGEGEVKALRTLLGAAARARADHPRDEKLWRALEATYLDPAETQELAAERLGLPFSTYRRHLTAALERVTDWLWSREV